MKKTKLLIILIVFTLRLSAQPFYQAMNGMVSIEAEHFTDSNGEWEEVEGRNAEPLEMQGQGIAYQNGIVSGQWIQLADSQVRIGWGIPFNVAHVKAYLDPDGRKAAVFHYRQGTVAGGFTFPAPRAFVSWPTMEYNEQGWSLFYNTLNQLLGLNVLSEILFVYGGVAPSAVDACLIEWLENQGAKVERVSDEELVRITVPAIPVVVSESVSSAAVDARFREHSSTVVLGEPFVLNKMGMVVARESWVPVEGEFGNAVMVVSPLETDSLIFALKLSSGQPQRVHLLSQAADARTRETLVVRFIDAHTRRLVRELKIAPESELNWRRSDPFELVNGEYLMVIKPGEETFESYGLISNRRYPAYRIDKIVVADGDKEISGNGPISKPQVVPNHLKASMQLSRFLPAQIWKAENGIVVVEAEDIDHHPNWALKREPAGFTGKGYLSWAGPSRSQSIEMLGGNDDDRNVRQGPQEQMLIIRVFVNEDGWYSVNARNIHQLEDGDNDAWVSMIGFKPWNRDAFDDRVRRMGDSHKDGKGFTWLDWGVRQFPLKKGINNLYIGGRSVGFGIDRIAVYPVNNPMAEEKALDVNTPVSKLMDQPLGGIW